MSIANSYLLQVWHDERGVWVVLKREDRLYQFESLETLAEFLKQETIKLLAPIEESSLDQPMALSS